MKLKSVDDVRPVMANIEATQRRFTETTTTWSDPVVTWSDPTAVWGGIYGSEGKPPSLKEVQNL